METADDIRGMHCAPTTCCGGGSTAEQHTYGRGRNGEELYQACAQARETAARQLVDLGAAVDYVSDTDGLNALFHALAHGLTGVASSLIDCGADVHIVASDGTSCLVAACASGMVDEAARIVARGADVHCERDHDRGTALYWACKRGSSELARALLARGARDVPGRRADGVGALYWALAHRMEDVALVLVEDASSVNVSAALRSDGTTPLHCACAMGLERAAHALLDAGALSVPARDGATALALADAAGIASVAARIAGSSAAPLHATISAASAASAFDEGWFDGRDLDAALAAAQAYFDATPAAAYPASALAVLDALFEDDRRAPGLAHGAQRELLRIGALVLEQVPSMPVWCILCSDCVVLCTAVSAPGATTRASRLRLVDVMHLVPHETQLSISPRKWIMLKEAREEGVHHVVLRVARGTGVLYRDFDALARSWVAAFRHAVGAACGSGSAPSSPSSSRGAGAGRGARARTASTEGLAGAPAAAARAPAVAAAAVPRAVAPAVAVAAPGAVPPPPRAPPRPPPRPPSPLANKTAQRSEPFSAVYPRLLERFDGPEGLAQLLEILLPAKEAARAEGGPAVLSKAAFARRISAAAGVAVPKAGRNSGTAAHWAEHIFTALDREGEGVTRRALGVGMQTLMNSPRRPNKREAERAPRAVAPGAAARAEAQRLETVCRSTFSVYDADGSGEITLREFAAQLQRALRMARAVAAIAAAETHGTPGGAAVYSDAQIDAMAGAMAAKCFEAADIDHSGAIDFAEFRRWFLNRARPSPAARLAGASGAARRAQSAAKEAPPQQRGAAAAPPLSDGVESKELTPPIAAAKSAFVSRSLFPSSAKATPAAAPPAPGAAGSAPGAAAVHRFDFTIPGAGPLGTEIGIDAASGFVVLQAVHAGGAVAAAARSTPPERAFDSPRAGDLVTAVNGRAFAPFDEIDADGNGLITVKEMEVYLRSLGHGNSAARVAREVLAAADRDGDGVVDLAEFKAFVTSGDASIDVVAQLFMSASRPLTLTLERGASGAAARPAPFDVALQRRRTLRIAVNGAGPLGAELATLLVPQSNSIVVEVRRLVAGSSLDALGARAGDWIVDVNGQALDIVGFLDSDGDGRVSREELGAALLQIDERVGRSGGDASAGQDAESLMRRYDVDGSGWLEVGELAALLNDVLLPRVVELLTGARPLRLTLARAVDARAQ